MKISFACTIIYDVGNRKAEPTMVEAFAELKRGNLNVEYISLWLHQPTVILTKKKL